MAVAKNYLSEEELRALNNLAEQYLIFAEGQAARRIASKVSAELAKATSKKSSTSSACSTTGASNPTSTG